jgi:SagB-type dehydrogenase family enzyme
VLASGGGIVAALRYHEDTKHVRGRLRRAPAVADPDERPYPYTSYGSAPLLPFPRDLAPSAMGTMSALAPEPALPPGEDRVLDVASVARLCFLANGVVRGPHPTEPGRDRRAAACTGALYHIELYVVCGDLPGLAAGVYHFDARENGLRLLRSGDHRALLHQATAHQPATVTAPAVLVCTSTPWRNAWRYGDRAYRHVFWDAGTVLAHLTAAARADRLPARIVLGFVDALVAAVLGIDPARELVVALVPVGCSARSVALQPPGAAELPRMPADAMGSVPDVPVIRAVHAASSLSSPEEVLRWRVRAAGRSMAPRRSEVGPPSPSTPAAGAVTGPSLEAVVRRRGSARAFADAPIGREALTAILRPVVGGLEADYMSGRGGLLTDCRLLVHRVEGLAPGVYGLRDGGPALTPLRLADLRSTATSAALGQPQAGQAAADVVMSADLPVVLAAMGDRGYRAAQLTAGVLAGRLYLAAYATGLAATGLTFFDDELAGLVGAPARAAMLMLVAVGTPRRREEGRDRGS